MVYLYDLFIVEPEIFFTGLNKKLPTLFCEICKNMNPFHFSHFILFIEVSWFYKEKKNIIITQNNHPWSFSTRYM